MLSLFSSGSDHPLADAKELKRIIGELPQDNAFKVVDEVVGWLESLETTENFRADKVFDVVRQLDEVAQPHIRKLTRDYLTSQRMPRHEERRFWTTALDFWWRLATHYERSLWAAGQRDRAADALKSQVPLMTVRLLGALGACLKWVHFKYGPVPTSYWKHLGNAYLVAEQGRFANKSVQVYPGATVASSPTQELLKSLVLSASSLDSLQPIEVELAEKLIAHFLPHFVLSAQGRQDNLYWIDLAEDRSPQRLALVPPPTPTLRFISPAQAANEVAEMIRTVERGEVPVDLALGGKYAPRLVLSVLRHIASYWSAKPPIRKHQRHPVKSQLFVLHGFDNCAAIFSGAESELSEQAESWVVENVSMGGFGASVVPTRDDWLRIGALLCMQPEGGENWLLGIVRRYGRENDSHAGVGIQTLARSAHAVRLKPRGSLSYGTDDGVTGIVFQEFSETGEVGVILPHNHFDVRESLDTVIDGKFTLLVPVELVESGPDFDVARYRQRLAD